MPSIVQKRSYGSVKVFWLDRDAAIDELRMRARRLLALHPEVHSVALFGSLANATATPRSDADILILLSSDPGVPFHQRGLRYLPHFAGIGIRTELFCYTLSEKDCCAFVSDAAPSAILLASRQ